MYGGLRDYLTSIIRMLLQSSCVIRVTLTGIGSTGLLRSKAPTPSALTPTMYFHLNAEAPSFQPQHGASANSPRVKCSNKELEMTPVLGDFWASQK